MVVSYYNDLHEGNIPGTEEESEVRALTGHRGDSGIQNHSCGPLYPWVHTYVENRTEGWGKHYYKHPDGRETLHRRFDLATNARTPEGCEGWDTISYRIAEEDAKDAIERDRRRAEEDRKRRRVRFQLGDTLPNGAYVIEHKGIVVLAAKRDRDGVVVEYVTWVVDNVGNASTGHYFRRLEDAAADYFHRINLWHGELGSELKSRR